MNIKIVHMLRADWLYDVRIKTSLGCPTDTVHIRDLYDFLYIFLYDF